SPEPDSVPLFLSYSPPVLSRRASAPSRNDFSWAYPVTVQSAELLRFLSSGTLYIDHALLLTYLFHPGIYFLGVFNVKAHVDGRGSLLAGPHIDGGQIDLSLRKDLRNIHQKSRTVIGVDIDLHGVKLSVPLLVLPLRIDQTLTLGLRQIQ